MVKEFLLTYENPRDHGDTFSWFDSEQDMRDFIKILDVKVIDAIRINDAEEIIL